MNIPVASTWGASNIISDNELLNVGTFGTHGTRSANFAVQNADLIILHTEWDEFKNIDFKKINKKRNLKIYDLRNIYNNTDMKAKKISYYSVGRPDIN